MNIILTANHSPWTAFSGGVQRSTHHLAQELAGLGHDVSVVFTRPISSTAEPNEPPKYTLHWAPAFALTSRSYTPLQPLNTISVAFKVRQIIQGWHHPGIIHAQGEEAALLAHLPMNGNKLVASARHGYYPPDYLSRRDVSLPRRIYRTIYHAKYALQKIVLTRADARITPSKKAAQLAANAYDLPASSFEVIPNGVNPAFAQVSRNANRADGPIVYFGRFAASKGFDVLLEAAERHGLSNIQLIGKSQSDTLGGRLRGLVESGQVDVFPWMPPAKLADKLSRASLVVLPSRNESFGLAIAEAMAVGAPVVSTTAGAIPELIDHGKTGWLVPPDDPDALAKAIRYALSHPEEAVRIGREARQHIREAYTWRQVALRHIAVYEDMLSDG